MKKLLLSIAIIGLIFIAGTTQKAAAQDVTVSFQMFYDELSPYGQWVYDPVYGNVWVPNEEGNFRPYGSRGHWVMTDYGNTWVSEDPWGWACYHYGRWTYDPYYGWIWIPGYEWAPAWVSWRYGDGYCGWAPLGPGVTVGYGYNCPETWWIFVPPVYMYHRDCLHYWRGPSYNPTYIRQTNVINNYYVDNSTHVRYNYGPRREVVERDTHQPVQVYRVSQMSRPGAPSVGGNRVAMYRPEVNRGTIQQARPNRVIEAPRAIGRPQQQNSLSPARQPQFRQDVQRHPEMMRQVAPQGNRPQGGQPQMPQRGQMPQGGQPQLNRQEPSRPQPQMNRPEPQRQQPQINRQEPQRAQPQFNRPEPPRPQPQMNRPEPQRQQPQPQFNRPEPQRQQPQPQFNRPEPQRQQPQFNRPEPQRQQPQFNRPEPPRPQPQPQPQFNRPEPPRPQPQPQFNRPEPPRPQPQPQFNRPQPIPQQRPQPGPPPQQQRGGEQHGRR